MLLFPLAAALAASLPAQLNLAGTALRNGANAFTRGGAGYGEGELLQRFDADEMRGFGIEAGNPGLQTVHGVMVVARDFGNSQPNGLVTISLYTEDPNQPNYPDVANPLGTVANVALSQFPGAPTSVFFVPPALAPIGRDVFVGIRVHATTSAFGGVRVNMLFGDAIASTYDLAGAGLPTSPPSVNSRRLFRDTATGAMGYLGRGQYMIDLLVATPSGFPTTLSNQASFAPSSLPPGLTTMMSGLHPDASDPPLHPGRADEVGFVFRDLMMAAGDPVVFVAAFADFGPVVALDGVVPGSAGALCLDPGALFPLAVGVLDANREAWIQTLIPAPVRTVIAGRSWTQQAVGYDLGSNTLRASLCGRQTF